MLITASGQLGPELILGSGSFFLARVIVPGLSGVAKHHDCHPLLVCEGVKRGVVSRRFWCFFAVPRDLSVTQYFCGSQFTVTT